ncbi:AEC family transporter [Selenihalanaerobacter shriftii]|uniref:Membrane transport protein n=1 Tax=Selenihalanaerobacter shriftii TaxID=142842 RepID=A0A1T4K3A4_9FIRM|nr:AEC family transporter [Selenihalanaerobacter shriftii]SJZ36879.1 hypothetical protein SAMN02745118_00580 [Selenihalanaerobacter shriftii]
MQFTIIINQILILFLMILVGYIVRKKGIINQEINEGLSNLLLEVNLPALIISSMTITINPTLITNIKTISFISIIIYLILIIVVTFLMKFLSISKRQKPVLNYFLIFGNVGYMGYPVIDTIYPEHGLFYAVIANLFFNLLMFTYGIYIFTKDNKNNEGISLKNLLNNGLIATVIGFILLFTGWQIPTFINGGLESLGNMTFPLSMLIIGSSLTNINFKTILSNTSLYLLSGLKLLVIPFIILLILKPFNIPKVINDITIILFAMPASASGVIFAEKFDSDYEFASEGVFFTTLLSLFTIPIFVYLITL